MTESSAGAGRSSPGVFERFVPSEVSGSVVLIACTLLAPAWANSPAAESYFAIAHTRISVWG
jgi:Na+/H+ antiporter NhaA